MFDEQFDPYKVLEIHARQISMNIENQVQLARAYNDQSDRLKVVEAYNAKILDHIAKLENKITLLESKCFTL